MSENIIKQKTCRKCDASFRITSEHVDFYHRISVPEPTLCPECRLQRRLVWRSERTLYRRNCDLCGKTIISVHHDEVPFPVYCPDCWWSDKWDPLSYGRDFDFNRPFFEQYKELLDVVPKAGMMHYQVENCEYNSYIGVSKNCYMCPGSHYLEECLFVRKSQNSKDSIYSSHIHHSELTAYSVNTKEAYNVHHALNCSNISDSAYISDCVNCRHCYMCASLYNKSFYIKNKPYSEKDYHEKCKEYLLKSQDALWEEFCSFNATIPKKYQHQINCVNSSGDNIQNCKNATEAYDGYGIEDSGYIVECVNVRDCMDMTMNDENVELCYELVGGGDRNYRSLFGVFSASNNTTYYTHFCPYLANSFGCDGIHGRMENCILNKRYGHEEYDKLLQKIITHMKESKEWGEFFPIELSIFPYNTSLAQDYFPLTEEEAKHAGYNWHAVTKSHDPATASIPTTVHDVTPEILNETLSCKICGANYKIVEQELAFCKKIGILPSRLCPDCRFKELITWKNPRKLWERVCDSCGKPIQTTYTPNRPDEVYCETCYTKIIN